MLPIRGNGCSKRMQNVKSQQFGTVFSNDREPAQRFDKATKLLIARPLTLLQSHRPIIGLREGKRESQILIARADAKFVQFQHMSADVLSFLFR